MFSTLTRRIIKTATLSLTVVSLSLGAMPGAQAFEFSIGMSNGDAGLSVGMGQTMMMGDPDQVDPRDYGPGEIPQQYFDDRWDALHDEGVKLQIFVKKNGSNVLTQQNHDCLMVKKIKALLAEMENNLAHYETLRAEHKKAGHAARVAELDQVIAEEKADIAKWQKELKKAERECNAKWM